MRLGFPQSAGIVRPLPSAEKAFSLSQQWERAFWKRQPPHSLGISSKSAALPKALYDKLTVPTGRTTAGNLIQLVIGQLLLAFLFLHFLLGKRLLHFLHGITSFR